MENSKFKVNEYVRFIPGRITGQVVEVLPGGKYKVFFDMLLNPVTLEVDENKLEKQDQNLRGRRSHVITVMLDI